MLLSSAPSTTAGVLRTAAVVAVAATATLWVWRRVRRRASSARPPPPALPPGADAAALARQLPMDVAALDLAASGPRGRVVIYYNGTFSPVHPGHVDAVRAARRGLEAAGYGVMGAFVSPCWAGYAAHKLGARQLDTRHRLAALRMAFAGEPHTVVDENEAFAPRFLMPSMTAAQLYERLQQALPEALPAGSFRIAWLRGADAGSVAVHHDWLLGVAVVNRSGFEAQVEHMQAQAAELGPGRCLVVHSSALDISSTAIRQAAQQGPAAGPRVVQLFQAGDFDLRSAADYLWQHQQLTPLPAELPDAAVDPAVAEVFFSEAALQPRLTPALLTAMLAHPGVTVTSFGGAELIGLQRGFRSTVLRIVDITYAAPDPAWPRTLILKVSRRRSADHATMERAEDAFYRLLAPRMLCARVPRCFFSAVLPCESDIGPAPDLRGVLLLEDVEPLGRPIDFNDAGHQLGPATLLVAARSLAELHAAWWRHPALESTPWIRRVPSDELFAAWDRTCNGIAGALVHMLDQQAPLPPQAHRALSHLARWVPAVRAYLSDADALHCTLMHGDLWINNLLFSLSESAAELAAAQPVLPEHERATILDWQTWGAGCPMFDLASLADAGAVPVGSPLETRLLQAYYTALCRHGVGDYSFQAMVTHFRLCLVLTTAQELPLLAHVALNPVPDAGSARARALLEDRLLAFDAYVDDMLQDSTSGSSY